MAQKREAVYVVGVGMTKFTKPKGLRDYPEMGLEASAKALLDAGAADGLDYDSVDAVVACYCYGDSTCGQRVAYQLGMTQVPVYNVNNNCSTGSTGLALGRDLLQGGSKDCVLVVGFERMAPGSLGSVWSDRASPLGTSVRVMAGTRGVEKAPLTAQMFGNAAREYIEKYGATKEDFAEIARVNHAHSRNNPYSQFRDAYSLEQVLKSPTIHDPLTKLQCCPTSDGAAAAVLVSERKLHTLPRHIQERAVLIAGQAITTDAPSLFSGSSMDLIGYDATREAARRALAEAELRPDDVQVVELHDCFSANEMVTLEAMGLCETGKAHEMVRRGDITYGGKYVVNPSGGLISKGHPLGATGLAQCAELVWHLRGWATNRAMGTGKNGGDKRTTAALQHNIGLGGACVVTVYTRADGRTAPAMGDDEIANVTGLGYNPAVEAGVVTEEQMRTVRSKKYFTRAALDEGNGPKARL